MVRVLINEFVNTHVAHIGEDEKRSPEEEEKEQQDVPQIVRVYYCRNGVIF